MTLSEIIYNINNIVVIYELNYNVFNSDLLT